jgi:hypothetical protein
LWFCRSNSRCIRYGCLQSIQQCSDRVHGQYPLQLPSVLRCATRVYDVAIIASSCSSPALLVALAFRVATT